MKVTKFMRDHKKEIVMTGCIVGGFVLGCLVGRKFQKASTAAELAKEVRILYDDIFKRECALMKEQTDIIFDALKSAQIIE